MRKQAYNAEIFNEDQVQGVDPLLGNDPLLNTENGKGDVRERVWELACEHAVEQFAIIGYSHGGGSVHDLCVNLNNPAVSPCDVEIVLTAYVDAIKNYIYLNAAFIPNVKKLNFAEILTATRQLLANFTTDRQAFKLRLKAATEGENRKPAGTLRHLNYYQHTDKMVETRLHELADWIDNHENLLVDWLNGQLGVSEELRDLVHTNQINGGWTGVPCDCFDPAANDPACDPVDQENMTAKHDNIPANNYHTIYNTNNAHIVIDDDEYVINKVMNAILEELPDR